MGALSVSFSLSGREKNNNTNNKTNCIHDWLVWTKSWEIVVYNFNEIRLLRNFVSPAQSLPT